MFTNSIVPIGSFVFRCLTGLYVFEELCELCLRNRHSQSHCSYCRALNGHIMAALDHEARKPPTFLVTKKPLSPDQKTFARKQKNYARRDNHNPCSMGFRDTQPSEPDEFFPEEIQVLDPRHPLHGQTFRVMGRSPYRGGNSLPSYEVEYRHGVTLFVPVATTERHAPPDIPTKLSIDALCELLNMVDCVDYHEHTTRCFSGRHCRRRYDARSSTI